MSLMEIDLQGKPQMIVFWHINPCM
jgi:hypothetical protein